MDTTLKKERIKEFDLARVVAIICMIAVHTEFAIYNYGNDTFGKVFDFLGSPFAAPMFMFILGANILTSSKNSPKKLFIRGVSIFSISLVFNVICHSLPFFILDFMNGQTEFAENALHWIFAVDILTFAGLAFIFFAVVRKLKLNKYIVAVIGVICSVVNILLTTYLPIDFSENTVSAVITSLFYSSSITGYFSFLSWIIFPIAGYVFMQFYSKVKNKNKFYLILGLFSIVIYTTMLLCSMHLINGNPLIDFDDEYSYYRMHPYGGIMNVFFCLAWISILYFVSKIIPKFLEGHILRLNRNLTTIYLVQWFIINYCFVLASNNTLHVNEWQFVICFVGVLVVSDLVAYLYKAYKKWSLDYNKETSK